MSLSKQSKVLTEKQIETLLAYVTSRRNGVRNRVILHLSVKAGLRAKEIACLKWAMLLNADGVVGDAIHLTNIASKGASGRVIPLNKALKESLLNLWQLETDRSDFNRHESHVIRSERSPRTSAQAVVNMFQRWYRDLNFVGCSSHSGRRTFITNTARKISLVGGSLRDVQSLAGHSNLQTTQRYIDHDTECQRKVVNLL
jgi:integrase/recombinase XerD